MSLAVQPPYLIAPVTGKYDHDLFLWTNLLFFLLNILFLLDCVELIFPSYHR